MTAINFPDSPTNGQQVTVGGVVYSWNSTKSVWQLVPGVSTLDQLQDVTAGSPSDNNLLAYDSATSNWTNQTASQAGVAAASHTHAQSNVTNLVSDLAAKAPLASPTFTGTVTTPLTTAGYVKTTSGGVISSSASVPQSDVTNLTSDLAGKAATSHTHAQSAITNLTSDLAAKANLSGATFTGGISSTSFQASGATGIINITSRTNSGFFEQSNPTTANGWPVTGSWYHLLTNTHSNGSNYYSQQFASDFFDSSNIFYRSTNGNGATAWRKMATGIGAVTYSTSDPSGGVDGDVWLKYTP